MTVEITIPPEDVERAYFDDTSGKPVQRVHGSGYVSPYLYGGPRGHTSTAQNGLARVPFTDFTTAAAQYHELGPYGSGPEWGRNFEGAAVGNRMFYTVGLVDSSNVRTLVEWGGEPTDLVRVITRLTVAGGASSGAPGDCLVADEDFVYIPMESPSGETGNLYILKVSRVDDTTSWVTTPTGKTNLLEEYPSELGNTRTHSALIEGDYLYLARTTGATGLTLESVPGYFNLVKVHKVTGAVEHVLIPRTTDDMTQDDAWIFLGIEVQNSTHHGYGWGAGAVRKSDLAFFALPALHATDTATTVSFASLIFGNFLLDAKTNGRVYIIDKTAPEGWSLASDVSQIVLASVLIDHGANIEGVQTWVVNELSLDEESHFIGWMWPLSTSVGSPQWSIAVRFEIPGFSVPTVPHVETREPVLDVQVPEATLRGEILASTGGAISDHGFYFGTTSPPTPKVSLGPGGLGLYSDTQSYIPGGQYFYRAYAVNPEGENVGAIVAFGQEGGRFQGVVTLGGVAVEGARVFAVEYNTLDSFETTTDVFGQYSLIVALAGNLYHLTCEYDDGQQLYTGRARAQRPAPLV